MQYASQATFARRNHQVHLHRPTCAPLDTAALPNLELRSHAHLAGFSQSQDSQIVLHVLLDISAQEMPLSHRRCARRGSTAQKAHRAPIHFLALLVGTAHLRDFVLQLSARCVLQVFTVGALVPSVRLAIAERATIV